MISKGVKSKLLTLLAFVCLPGCTPQEETPRRWRVTVEVETAAGIASGSTVVETHFRPRNELLQTMDANQRWVVGEAVTVVVPQGVVCALLDNEGEYGFYRSSMNSFGWVPGPNGRLRRLQIYPAETAETKAAAAANRARHASSREEIRKSLAAGKPFTLLEEGWPRFVLLRDPADPATAVNLVPTELAEAAFDDLRIRRIVVQETDAPVTRTLVERLPWLKGSSAMPLSGRLIDPPQIPADLLNVTDFSRSESM